MSAARKTAAIPPAAEPAAEQASLTEDLRRLEGIY